MTSADWRVGHSGGEVRRVAEAAEAAAEADAEDEEGAAVADDAAAAVAAELDAAAAELPFRAASFRALMLAEVAA